MIRRHSGERVDPREYLREYPAQAPELSELLNTDDQDQSTQRAGADPTVIASTMVSPKAPAPRATCPPNRRRRDRRSLGWTASG